MQLLLINGPNLNLLGTREPHIYGNLTLDDVERQLKKKSHELGVDLDCFQSNSEGEIINSIHAAFTKTDGILINAGAYTHTSIALRDALLGVQIPYVELHLSNVYSREKFRQHSFLSDAAIGFVSGFGPFTYELALQGMVAYLTNTKKKV